MFNSTFQAMRQLVFSHTGTQPTLHCVKPMAAWQLPAGYAYDADYDAIVNSGGEVWTPTTSSLPYDTVDILPSRGALELDLTAGGMIDTGDRVVRILPTDRAIVDAAQWFLLDGIEYVKDELTPVPAGAPMYYSMRLRKR